MDVQGFIEITDSGASLKITDNGESRFILKRHIREVYIIEPSVVKLDIGEDGLRNIYLKHTQVGSPQTQSAEELRDAINEMLRDDCITEINQTNQQINQQISQIAISVDAINSEIFIQASIVEQINQGEIYYGYALPGSVTFEPVWAIQKVTENKGISTYQWADGNKNFDNVWDDRGKLQYS